MMTPEEKAQRAAERKAAREAAKEYARIEEQRNQPHVKSIKIMIEWKKSRTWGSNPHARADVEYRDNVGPYGGRHESRAGFTCSGCGYDKESTVIADVFNAFLRYKLHARREKEPRPYGIYFYSDGASYSGGIGTSCYRAISEFIGGKFENIASGSTFDVYEYTDMEE